MRHDFAVCLAQEVASVGDQFVAQYFEILDDPIVDQRYWPGDMRVSIADRRRAVRRPACVRDTDFAAQWIGVEFALQIVELALGPTPVEPAALHGHNPG